MTDDSVLRREIKRILDGARSQILNYTGLYPEEDLARDVLRACREAGSGIQSGRRLDEARSAVEARCRQLVQAADRFGVRDLALITASRARAVAAVDMFQDLALEARRAEQPAQTPGPLLKKRAF